MTVFKFGKQFDAIVIKHFSKLKGPFMGSSYKLCYYIVFHNFILYMVNTYLVTISHLTMTSSDK